MKKDIRIALLDFDGTLVSQDILDVLCQVVGKEKESQEINAAFHRGEIPGLSGLVQRINFLSGMSRLQIEAALQTNTFLMPGTHDLFAFFKENNIKTILASGNIVPVLEYYQKLLGIDYVIGSQPEMSGDEILSITEAAFSSKNFKVDGITKILNELNIQKDQVIAIGDSPSDRGMFELSGFSVAFNPKGNIAEFADLVASDDLQQVAEALKKL